MSEVKSDSVVKAEPLDNETQSILSAGLVRTGRVKQLDPATLLPHPSQPRTGIVFADNVNRLEASIRLRGYDQAQPLVVSQHADGTLYTLRGGSRAAAAKRIALKTVPCIVLTGLTLADEIPIVLDHTEALDRQKLDKWGEFLSVLAIVTGMGVTGRKAIATMLGMEIVKVKDGVTTRRPNESRAQWMAQLAQLPQYVREAYRQAPLFDGDKYKQLKSEQLAGLYTAWSMAKASETNIGKTDEEIGNDPAFRAKWDEVFGSEPATGKSSAPTRKQVAAVASMVDPMIRDAMLLATGQKEGASIDTHLAPLSGLVSQYRTDSAILGNIRKHLGDVAFAELVEASKPVDDVEDCWCDDATQAIADAKESAEWAARDAA